MDFQRFGTLIRDPESFFKEISNETSVQRAFAAYALVAFLTLLIGTTIGSMLTSAIYSGINLHGLVGFQIILAIIWFALYLAGIFIYAAMTHGLIILFEGTNSYATTFNVFAYSMLPCLVLSIIPFVGWLAFIYTLILETIGLSTAHRISKGKAFLAAFLPGVFLAGILIIAIVGLFLAT